MNDKDTLNDIFTLLIPSIIFSALFSIIKVTEINKELFLTLNQLSLYTTKGLWVFFTFWGDALASTILLIPFIKKRPDILWAGIISGVVIALVVNFLKDSYGIKRPPAIFEIDEFIHIGRMVKNRSFPSGHTATAFWLAGTLAFSFKKTKITLVLLILASLIGFSRIAVGVHWPLDVIMGALIGWSLSYLGHLIYKTFIKKTMLPAVRVFMILFTLLSFYISLFYNCHYPRALSTKIIIPFILGLWGIRETLVMFKNNKVSTVKK